MLIQKLNHLLLCGAAERGDRGSNMSSVENMHEQVCSLYWNLLLFLLRFFFCLLSFTFSESKNHRGRARAPNFFLLFHSPVNRTWVWCFGWAHALYRWHSFSYVCVFSALPLSFQASSSLLSFIQYREIRVYSLKRGKNAGQTLVRRCWKASAGNLLEILLNTFYDFADHTRACYSVCVSRLRPPLPTKHQLFHSYSIPVGIVELVAHWAMNVSFKRTK